MAGEDETESWWDTWTDWVREHWFLATLAAIVGSIVVAPTIMVVIAAIYNAVVDLHNYFASQREDISQQSDDDEDIPIVDTSDESKNDSIPKIDPRCSAFEDCLNNLWRSVFGSYSELGISVDDEDHLKISGTYFFTAWDNNAREEKFDRVKACAELLMCILDVDLNVSSPSPRAVNSGYEASGQHCITLTLEQEKKFLATTEIDPTIKQHFAKTWQAQAKLGEIITDWIEKNVGSADEKKNLKLYYKVSRGRNDARGLGLMAEKTIRTALTPVHKYNPTSVDSLSNYINQLKNYLHQTFELDSAQLKLSYNRKEVTVPKDENSPIKVRKENDCMSVVRTIELTVHPEAFDRILAVQPLSNIASPPISTTKTSGL